MGCMQQGKMTFHTRLACFALLVTWSASYVTASWCRSEDIAPFSSALEYVELTEGTEFIGEGELQTLIMDAFKRASCDDQDLGMKTCNNCLEAAHVFQLLRVESSPGLNEENFAKATTLIVHYMYQLPEMCNKTDSIGWEKMTYHDLVDEFKEAFHDHDDDHDHDHDHGFSWSQLEDLVMAVNGTYKPGERVGEDIVDPDPDVCSNVPSFRSGDVYQRSAMEHPEEGVTDSELASMNSVLLFYLLRGDCIREDLRVDSEVPEPDDFIFALFEEFADPDSCLIKEEGFSQLLWEFMQMTATTTTTITTTTTTTTIYKTTHDQASTTMAFQTQPRCEDQLAAVFGFDLSVGLSREELEEMSPTLIQQAAQGCMYTQEEEEEPRPDAGAVWGYSILSVIIVSAFAPLGLFITRWSHAPIYKYIMTLFLGLGVGSLSGDALLHLVPEAIGSHSHGPGDDHEEDNEETWKMFMACLGIWLLFIMQLLLEYADMYKKKSKVSVETNVNKGTQGSIKQIHENPAMSSEDLSAAENDKQDLQKMEMGAETKADQEDKSKPDDDERQLDVYADDSLGWIVSVGDCLHNFADGMAIGASYAVDLGLGLSTTIAIFFHEIPHEFGDVAVMLSAGWKRKKILLMQAFTQSMALIGLFVGIPVAQIDGATEWILALAAGLFIYVALSNVIPELVQYFKQYDPLKVFLWANLGIGIGYAIMLIIAMFEGSINI